MSVDLEIDALVEDQQGERQDDTHETISMATREVSHILSATEDSVGQICTDIESASTEESCRAAFRRFNGIMRIFLGTINDSNDRQVCEAVCSFDPSRRLRALLESQSSVREAIVLYKRMGLKDLVATIQSSIHADVTSEEKDDELFAQFLSGQVDDEQEARGTQSLVDPLAPVLPAVISTGRKRGTSELLGDDDPTTMPAKKKSQIPALNALSSLAGADDTESTGKKRLLTREKLRSGLHDPKGLLDLAGPSTNALDRTKKLELLKGAGYDFNYRGRGTSFYDKFNAAELRLDLGLGAHSVVDSRLFGAKVLSLLGFLPRKIFRTLKTTW